MSILVVDGKEIHVIERAGKGGPGAPGADGQSAYEVAVAGGFVGTEEEWLESLKAATRGFWTPASTPIVGPAPFNILYSQGTVALSNSDYTLTGFGGYCFTGLGLPHDAILRGHAVTLDTTGIANGEAFYVASLDGDDITTAVNGHGFILIWDTGNSRFDVMGGNIMVDTPTALGTMTYTNGQELAFGNDNAGNISLYLDGVLQFSMVATTVMVAASVSFGVYIATGGPANLQATIVQTPAFSVPAITQYTTSTPGPIVYPPDRAGKIFEVEGVAPGGIVVEGYRLKNGMWAEFDQTLALVPPLEPEVPFLTQPQADSLYQEKKPSFLNQLVPPSPADDFASIGAKVESKWQVVTGPLPEDQEWWICGDPAISNPGNAVWILLSLTPDEFGSMALEAAGSGPTQYRNNAAQDTAITNAILAADLGRMEQVVITSSPYYIQPEDSGKVLVSYLASPVTVVVSLTALKGKTFGLFRAGTGSLEVSQTVGWTLLASSAASKLTAQGSFASLYCYQNPGDLQYYYTLAGELTT